MVNCPPGNASIVRGCVCACAFVRRWGHGDFITHAHTVITAARFILRHRGQLWLSFALLPSLKFSLSAGLKRRSEISARTNKYEQSGAKNKDGAKGE